MADDTSFDLDEKHAAMANAIRALAMDAVQKANSGHPGMPMGAADIATVLYTRHLRLTAIALFYPRAMGPCCFMHCFI